MFFSDFQKSSRSLLPVWKKCCTTWIAMDPIYGKFALRPNGFAGDSTLTWAPWNLSMSLRTGIIALGERNTVSVSKWDLVCRMSSFNYYKPSIIFTQSTSRIFRTCGVAGKLTYSINSGAQKKRRKHQLRVMFRMSKNDGVSQLFMEHPKRRRLIWLHRMWKTLING